MLGSEGRAGGCRPVLRYRAIEGKKNEKDASVNETDSRSKEEERGRPSAD